MSHRLYKLLIIIASFLVIHLNVFLTDVENTSFINIILMFNLVLVNIYSIKHASVKDGKWGWGLTLLLQLL